MNRDDPNNQNGHSDIYRFARDFGNKASPLSVYNYGIQNTSGLIFDKFYLGTRPTNFVGLQMGRPQFNTDYEDFSGRPAKAWNPQQAGVHILRKPKILPQFQ